MLRAGEIMSIQDWNSLEKPDNVNVVAEPGGNEYV